MPGPGYGIPPVIGKDIRSAHSKCREKEECTGGGCALYTGKTAARRKRGKARRLKR